MKKFFALIIAVLTMSLALTGCSNSTTPLAGASEGSVISGNGSFAVEKGDYVYFINGVGDVEGDNTFGKVEKGSLVRAKTTELGLENANIETVIPKLMTVSGNVGGVYIYDNDVYYATPYTGKDKTGKVRKDYVQFQSFDLKTGKASDIVFETRTVSNYKFVETADGVYLIYLTTEKVGETETKAFSVINAVDGKSVFSADNFSEILLPEDGGLSVFYTKLAYSESLQKDENFGELYRYTVGKTDAELILSGAGSDGRTRDGRGDLPKSKFLDIADISGLTFNLIKNTGKLFVFKTTGVDSNYKSITYFGIDLLKEDGSLVDDFSKVVKMGVSGTYLDAAITATAYYKSLSEIYYIENSTYLKGLVKFDYNKANSYDHGRTLISSEAATMTFASVEGEYMYLINAAEGIYYRIKYATVGADLKKINGVAMKTLTDWFAPRVIGNTFIGSYSGDYYYGYVYTLDISGVDGEAYEDYLKDVAVVDKAHIEALNKKLLGKMTKTDRDAFDEKLKKDYPETDAE